MASSFPTVLATYTMYSTERRYTKEARKKTYSTLGKEKGEWREGWSSWRHSETDSNGFKGVGSRPTFVSVERVSSQSNFVFALKVSSSHEMFQIGICHPQDCEASANNFLTRNMIWQKTCTLGPSAYQIRNVGCVKPPIWEQRGNETRTASITNKI